MTGDFSGTFDCCYRHTATASSF
eukprot:COSAG06_NODE_9621_length_1857_cov_1.759386_3_plen_22_part_01